MTSTDNVLDFKKGDAIISNGKVFIITKVKEKENMEGVKEPYIFYKPFFENNVNKSMTCSLPISSFIKTNKRKPITTEKLKELIDILTQKVKKTEKVTIIQANEILKTNNPLKIAGLAKELWSIKNDQEGKLSHTDNNILKKSLELLSQEFAFVKNLNKESALEHIKSKLNKD